MVLTGLTRIDFNHLVMGDPFTAEARREQRQRRGKKKDEKGRGR